MSSRNNHCMQTNTRMHSRHLRLNNKLTTVKITTNNPCNWYCSDATGAGLSVTGLGLKLAKGLSVDTQVFVNALRTELWLNHGSQLTHELLCMSLSLGNQTPSFPVTTRFCFTVHNSPPSGYLKCNSPYSSGSQRLAGIWTFSFGSWKWRGTNISSLSVCFLSVNVDLGKVNSDFRSASNYKYKMKQLDIVVSPPAFLWDPYYQPRSKGDNTFGHVRPFVCLFVCLRSNFWIVWPMTLIFCMRINLDLG